MKTTELKNRIKKAMITDKRKAVLFGIEGNVLNFSLYFKDSLYIIYFGSVELFNGSYWFALHTNGARNNVVGDYIEERIRDQFNDIDIRFTNCIKK